MSKYVMYTDDDGNVNGMYIDQEMLNNIDLIMKALVVKLGGEVTVTSRDIMNAVTMDLETDDSLDDRVIYKTVVNDEKMKIVQESEMKNFFVQGEIAKNRIKGIDDIEV